MRASNLKKVIKIVYYRYLRTLYMIGNFFRQVPDKNVS